MHKPSLIEHITNFIGNKISNRAVAIRVSTFALLRPLAHLGVKDYVLHLNFPKVGSLSPATCLDTTMSSYSKKGSTSPSCETSSS